MAQWRETDWLVGRRYVADFRVAVIGDRPPGGREEDRECVLHMYGERYVISLGELRTLIEAGLVTEAPERGQS